MNSVYNKRYYEEYNVGVASVDYSTSQYTKAFLESIAERIVNDLQPKTVLDAGCAMGHLVAALRDRGVEAYGIDISEYAVTHAREDIREYCFQGSLAEPMPKGLPERFDLVVSIEVLEHLYTEDGEKAIANLCKLTDAIIFSSTPDDFSDPTHLNVQQREYWARLFAQNGFLDDLVYRPKYLTYHAVCYRRRENMLRQIQDYERNIHQTEDAYRCESEKWSAVIQDQQKQIAEADRKLNQREAEKQQMIQTHAAELARMQEETEIQVNLAKKAVTDMLEQTHQNEISEIREKSKKELKASEDEHKAILDKANAELKSLGERCNELKIALDEAHLECKTVKKHRDDLQVQYETSSRQRKELQEHYEAAINQRNALALQKNDYLNQLEDISARYQEILDCTCWKMTKPIRAAGTATKKALKRCSVTRLFYKGCSSLMHEGPAVAWKRVKAYMKKERPTNTCIITQEEIEKQRKTKFPKAIKFSILVPLYNTPEKFLREMIQSVIDQTYGNWELCLADGSDKAHRNVKQICLEYRAADKRIKYKKLHKNLGISGNTNACIEMACGEYITLFDHDDLLHPAALYENMKVICEQDADFIYTDENTFHATPIDAYCPNFKPDFAPDTLRSYNYICHLSTFKASLLKKVGKFRPEFDGSQDYDMILRLTEKAEKIVHIPKVLYYWRSHASSVAADISAKPYTLVAAKKALKEHLQRVGLEGEVYDAKVLSMYRIAYKIKKQDLVSILIPNKDHVNDLKKCIDSIISRTTYPDWEIVVIENNSTETQTFQYYEVIKHDARIRVVEWDGAFNYSAINNYGAKYAKGEYILLLNNDTEVITPDWLEQMIMFAQRSDVGAVGAKLYYPDDTIQHAGVILGIGGVAGHSHKYYPRNDYGYMGRLILAQNLSAVTAACLLLRKSVWDEIGGLNEAFAVAFNDVDFCMRIREAGYLIVFTPFAELYHYESKSRGLEDTPEKQMRFAGEIQKFQSRWQAQLDMGDPYYNPNLTLKREDFTVRP